MTDEERSNIKNGIWLCGGCHTLADSDEQKFTVQVLEGWKKVAEARAADELRKGSAIREGTPNKTNDARYAMLRRKEQLQRLTLDDRFIEQYGVWCMFFDTLVDHMRLSPGQYSPGLDQDDALHGVFTPDKKTLWGKATFVASTSPDGAVASVIFGVSPADRHEPTWWDVSTPDGKVLGFFDKSNRKANQKLLRQAEAAVNEAIFAT